MNGESICILQFTAASNQTSCFFLRQTNARESGIEKFMNK